LSSCRACDLEVISVLFPQLAGLSVERAGDVVHLQVRRFFCRNDARAAVTFAEQVPAVAGRRARRTAGLTGALQAIALALGGRAGSRLSGRLASPASRSTLLRLIRARPDLPAAAPRVLAVDDFALRRGHVYGTVLVDIQTRRRVDVLPERSADSFESWLGSRPAVEGIRRDRGGCYAEGAARGAPLADRWHPLHNLGEAVERAVARHRFCLRDEAVPPRGRPARGRNNTSLPPCSDQPTQHCPGRLSRGLTRILLQLAAILV